MRKKAIIISIKGLKLETKEKILLRHKKPWGVILFQRNIKSLNQIKNLILSIRRATKDLKFPILIDEEGDKVSRLKKILKHDLSQHFFGNIYKKNPSTTLKIYKSYINDLCFVLKNIGININTVPVLDVLRKNTHNVIGNRSFSNNPKIVKKLGLACIRNYNLNKIGTVIKHIPGHGCSSLDSHFALPVVKDSYKRLNKNDFLPFKSSPALFAMTAHVKYLSLYKDNVATFSKKILHNLIRKKLNFKGIIISDDISMKSLKYDLLTNSLKALSAGCNLILYCAGKYSESKKLLEGVPFIDKFTEKKTSEFYKFLS